MLTVDNSATSICFKIEQDIHRYYGKILGLFFFGSFFGSRYRLFFHALFNFLLYIGLSGVKLAYTFSKAAKETKKNEKRFF